ncbi:MAG TPA: PliI family lysozyme inhibitor of I-type lysozyme [Mucilaginibacter sp.]|nr:PliI family lysozyme inhibitor of I-type lysozyme [Mucilaginibacter sp.]
MRAGRYSLLLLSCLAVLAACNHDEQKASPPPAPVKKPDYVAPFRFHKLVEVAPGQDYDVLSWGRGSALVGSFLILHSDSAAKKYITTTGDLDGTIVDVYNSDMDLDGNPELLIQARGADSTNYATIYAFEFTNDRAQKLNFPKLTKSQSKGYRGDDNFYISEGKFMREFPIYDGTGKDAKPTGAKRVLEYGLRNNSFTVKQLSKDSADNKATPVVQKPSTNTSTAKKSSSSKKHTTEKRSKKKHRRHRG